MTIAPHSTWLRRFRVWFLRFFVLLAVFIVWLVWDEARPQYEDLKPRPRSDRAAQARWALLCEHTKQLSDTYNQYYPSENWLKKNLPESSRKGPDHWPEETSISTNLRMARDLPINELEKLADNFEPILGKLPAIFSEEPLEFPLPESFEEMSAPYTRPTTQALFLITAEKIRRRDWLGAVEDIEKYSRMAALWDAAGGDVVTIASANGLRTTALRALTLLAEQADGEAGMTSRLHEVAERMRPVPEPYRESVRVDHHRALLLIDSVLAGDSIPTDPRDLDALFSLPGVTKLHRIALRPNETRRMVTVTFRHGMSLIEGPYPRHVDHDAYLPRVPYRPNMYGRYLVHLSTGAYSTHGLFYLGMQTNVSAFQAWLALRAYHRQEGSYPETLAPLVPDFLSSIPKDHLNDTNISYDTKYNAVWSVPGKETWETFQPFSHRGRGAIVYWLTPEAHPDLVPFDSLMGSFF